MISLRRIKPLPPFRPPGVRMLLSSRKWARTVSSVLRPFLIQPGVISMSNNNQSAPAAQNPSTGPRTQAGKSISSQNARKHDRCSRTLHLTPEEWTEYNDLCARYRRDLRPASEPEQTLVDEICSTTGVCSRPVRLNSGSFLTIRLTWASSRYTSATAPVTNAVSIRRSIVFTSSRRISASKRPFVPQIPFRNLNPPPAPPSRLHPRSRQFRSRQFRSSQFVPQMLFQANPASYRNNWKTTSWKTVFGPNCICRRYRYPNL
jgi:hypothetical protein